MIIFDRGTFNTLEILSGKSETFPFNLVRFRESVSSDPQKTQPDSSEIFSEYLRFHLFFFSTIKDRYRNVPRNLFHNVRKCTEETISKAIWVGTGALDTILN